MFTFTPIFGQIKITDVGDGWKGKVEQALDTIQNTIKKSTTLLWKRVR